MILSIVGNHRYKLLVGNYSTDPTYATEDVISQQGKLTMQVVFSTARANQTMNAGFETGHGKLKWWSKGEGRQF